MRIIKIDNRSSMLGGKQAPEETLSAESFYSLRLNEWSKRIPLTKLSKVWEKNILALVPSELLKRHPQRVELTLREIRDIYENDMRHCAIASIVKKDNTTDDDAVKDEEQIKNVKEELIGSRDERYCNVSEQRAILANKYFLSHIVVKHIVTTANSVLPRVIVDLDDYRKSDLFEMSELQEAMKRSVERCAVTIENDYYNETVRVIASHSRLEKNVDRKRFGKLINCATSMFVQQIVKVMMNTIDELTEKLGDYSRHSCPRLALKLEWNDNCLSIEPAISKVHYLWHSLIDSIESIANNLSIFQDAIAPIEDTEKNVIKISLPDWYMKRSHDRIETTMSNVFEPLRSHFASMAKQFDAVTSLEIRDNDILCDSVSKGRNSKIYCLYVKKLKGHYAKANEMIDRVEYDIGRLSQSEAKRRLKDHIVKMINIIVEKLSIRHIEYNNEICRDFKELEDRMLDIPKDAEALFKLSEMICYASRTTMEKLETRVRKSIEMLGSLIVITSEMTEEHMNLNATTINWLVRIAPVFNRSNTLCEAMKSELEDELQRKISKLKLDIDAIVPQLEILDDMDDVARVEEYEVHLAVLVDRLDELDRQIERINFEERLFKFPETSFPSVMEIRNILIPIEVLNSLTCRWRRDNSVWLDGPFEYIVPEVVTSKTTSYHDQFNKLNSTLKTKIKTEMQSSGGKRLLKLAGIVDDPDPMQQPAPLKLCWQVLREVEKFKDYLELIVCMCNPALCERHWEEMSLIYYGNDEQLITPNAGTTLRKFIALDLNRDIAKYKVISVGANNELALGRQLDGMIARWDEIDFTLVVSSDDDDKSRKPSTFLNLDEIRIVMDEHFVLIREMKVSYFVKPIASALEEFNLSLVRVNDLIERWLDLQHEWFDMEPIFRCPPVETSEQLQLAGKLFYQLYEPVDTVERDIIEEPKFRSLADKSSRLLALLREAAERLDGVKESVRKYIEEVRGIYPRFNFVSDRSVTRILFEPKIPKRIELMLKHCFNGVRSIRLGEPDNAAGIVSVIDDNDQELSLPNRAEEPLIYEASLSSFAAVERAMRSAVRREILRSFRRSSYKSANDWSSISIGELCGAALYWTCKVEEAFRCADPTVELTRWCRDQQSPYLQSIAMELRGKVLRNHRNNLVSMIILVRQQLDITRLLIAAGEKRALSRRDFDWKAQPRNYWRDDDVEVEILDTRVPYGYEYSSSERPMVSTPVTDRCFRTVIEAHRNRLHGALFGPAASAKTQCIQSLAKTLGVPLRLFDCQETFLNYTCIGNLFRGLIGCSPCWLSLENVDFLTIEMQSVLAQRISALWRIVPENSSVRFQGASLHPREPNCCFVTVTSTSYPNSVSNQRHLTDSLKILFRPVAMTTPDRRRVVEITLFAEGFANAAILSQKNHLLERYASDMLTTVASYDFSMRTAMRVVNTACALRHRYPDVAEDGLFLRAILDVHLPNLARTDVVVFKSVIDDLFPGVELAPPNYDKLLSAVELVRGEKISSADLRGYGLKVIQMFETLLVRHALIVVGPALAGKTSLIDDLGASLSLLDDQPDRPPVKSARINHVSLSSEELLGRYELNDFGKVIWKDGLLTRKIRCFAGGDEKHDRKDLNWQWIVLDGPMDQSFLEKFDSLLDDNKTLSLTSGERIRISDSMSLIFETTSIEKSSPSAISRCGVVYVDEETISLNVHIDRWIAKHRDIFIFPNESSRNESEEKNCQTKDTEFFGSLLKWSLPACLGFVKENLTVVTNNRHMTISALRLLEMYLSEATGLSGSAAQPETNYNREGVSVSLDRARSSQMFVWFQAALVMAIVWGIGGGLDRPSRTALDQFCTSLWLDSTARPHRELMKRHELALPSEGHVQDNTYTFTGNGSWRHWSDVLKKDSEQWTMSSEACRTNYVPTIESVRYMSLFETHVKYRRPFVVSGETATGKTLYMRHLLKTKICQSRNISNFMSLGGGSGIAAPAADVGRRARQIFISKITKVRRGVYAPGESRLFVNFIDDLNLSKSSDYEGDAAATAAAAALELIRQFYDNFEWHEIESGDTMRLVDVMFLGALTRDSWNDSRGEREWREPRFFRHFSIYNVDEPSRESAKKIYSTVLLANLRKNLFNPDVSGSVNGMVDATIDVYTLVRQKLRPVPSKFHYQFSLRDVARVITGCSLIHKDSAESKSTLARLWVHEAIRVFADRIVDEEDHEWLFGSIRDSVRDHFSEPFETIFDNLPKNADDQLTRESFRDLIFSDFMDADWSDRDRNGDRRRRYEEVLASGEALRNKAIAYLKRYNELAADKLDVLILSGSLEHLLRISRILGTPGGSLLIISFGGSGRRSLTALAASLKAHNFHELSYHRVSSSSSLEDTWRKDVKRACTNCIASTGPTIGDCTFFVTDRQIFGGDRSGNILGEIRSLMKTGGVQDLFTDDETDDIVEKCRLMAQNGDRNLEISRLSVMDYFYNKCQEKLHFVLYFDRTIIGGRVGDYARATILKSIVNHCSIDCHECWPDEAFNEIGKKFMEGIDIVEDVKSRAIVASKYFYDSVRDVEEVKMNGGLPVASYIHMVKLYGISITRRQREITASRKRYMRGLEKLELAGEEVREIKRTLTSLRPELELSAKETEDTMRKIERENISVENATVQVKREEQVANKIAEVAGILKEECEAELAVAIPILEDAVAALNTLKPTDITLVKAMKNPPDTVKLVMAAVCVMLNVSPDRSVDPVTGKKSIDYWPPSKRVLGDMNFLQNLKDYDKDNIPSGIMSLVNKTYMSDENFQPRIVAKASSAAEGLCKWVRAMVSYDEIAKVVAPKKEKLAVAEKECNASLAYLNEKRISLEALNDKLAALNVVLESTLAKKLALEKQVENCTNKLRKAESLITSLAGEKSRWLKSAESLGRSYELLAGDILLSCGIVALLGAMNADDRRIYLGEWIDKLVDLSIPNSSTLYDFVESLETEVRTSGWHRDGLSDDTFSRENAAIASNSLLWPFFVDPQNQANIWIKRTEEANQLRVVKAATLGSRWLGEIVACVEDDVPVLVENFSRAVLSETTAALDYVLSRLCPRHKHNNSNFRLYITSRLHRIALPEASSGSFTIIKKMSVIDFSLTDDAIENRLLGIVISREKPELHDKFDKSTAESAHNKRALREEEDNILTILSSSSVNIVDDARALETLDYSKNLSLAIMRREEAARSTNREIDEIRCNYRPLANYCAALYDTLVSLGNINHMYGYSLDWFTRLYVRSIDRSMKSALLDKRLNYLRASFTEILHESVRNSLLDKHKLVYSFLLSTKTLLHSERTNRDEIVLFREILSFTFRQDDKHRAETITIDDEHIIAIAEKLRRALPNVFQNLPESLRKDATSWRLYRESNDASSSTPEPWNGFLTEFQRLILVGGVKPERTTNEVIAVVEKTLKTRLDSLTSKRYSIASFFEESSCLVPLIFVLPSYLEVYRVVVRWAETIGYSSRVSRFSMGEARNSESSIETAIERARVHGGWILLENCHLASDEWLDRIERIYESLSPSNTTLSFRLWLTSYPCERFPISVLQNSVKINWETPSGTAVKENLLRCYQTEPLNDPKFYDSCPGNNKLFAKLIYSMCFFHTVARGRDKFGKRGWYLPSYEFTDEDLKISIEQLRIFLNNSDDRSPTNFDTLNYLIGECYYGGTIFDPLDRKLISAILRDYCNPQIARANDKYVFAIDLEGRRYYVPNRSEYHDFKKHIVNTLPVDDSPPEIFGLDVNAANLRDCRNATDFIESLSLADNHRPAIEPHSLTIDRRRILIREIRSKLLPTAAEHLLDVVDAKKKYPRLYAEPLNSLLIEEIDIYNNLLEIIRDSILDVERTHDEGLAPLFLTFAAIEQLAESLNYNRVPTEWTCTKKGQRVEQSLPQFIDYLSKRRQFLCYWIETGHSQTSFWLGGIVRCNKFISASRLTLARQNSINLSHLAIDYEILDTFLPCRRDDPSTSESGISIHGLFLSGAGWDIERSTLVESFPKVHWVRMPAIRLVPRTTDSEIYDEDSTPYHQCFRYACPVKGSSTTKKNLPSFGSLSTNCIATVPLNSRDTPPEHWTKRTTVLFCNRDE